MLLLALHVQPPGYASGMASGNPAFTYNGKAVVEHMANHCSTEVDLTEPGLLSAGKKHKVRSVISVFRVRSVKAPRGSSLQSYILHTLARSSDARVSDEANFGSPVSKCKRGNAINRGTYCNPEANFRCLTLYPSIFINILLPDVMRVCSAMTYSL